MYTSEQVRNILIRSHNPRNITVTYNDLTRRFGVEEGWFLSYLFNILNYFLDPKYNKKKKKLRDGKWFYCTVARMERDSCLTARQQSRVITKLVKLGTIETRVFGVPPKRHFHLNVERIEQLVNGPSVPENDKSQISLKNPIPTVPGELNQTEGFNSYRSVGIEYDRSVGIHNTSSTKKSSITQSPHAATRSRCARTRPGGEATKREADSVLVTNEDRSNLVTNQRTYMRAGHGNRKPLGTIFPSSGKTERVEARHRIWAQQLRDALRERKVPVTNPRPIPGWAKQFALLETIVPADKIEEVLTWYCSHLGKPYVPQAFGGKTFRNKFVQIAEAVKRDLQDNPTFEVNEVVRSVVASFSDRRWPKGSDQWLTEFVARSYKAAMDLANRVLAWEKSDGVDPYLKDVLKSLVFWPQFQNPETFTRRWIKWVHTKLSTWTDWSGTKKSFMSYLFAPDHEEFQRWGRTWSLKDTGKTWAWDRFNTEVIGKCD